MKKFVIGCITIALIYLLADFAYLSLGFYLPINKDQPVETFVKNEGKEILLNQGAGYEPFEIKGVDLGVGMPGHFATDYAITKDIYLRWFQMISDMGANTIRVYTILHDDFYEAFYEYNLNNESPLYLIHGLWVNDYIQNSRKDAYDSEYLDVFIRDGINLINVLHGNKRMFSSSYHGSGTYTKDVSPWVLGYILGVEWEDLTVAYTDHMRENMSTYEGKYMSTKEGASAFEAMLARVGDRLISYESDRYHQQRLVAFSNWPTTDPFDYPDNVAEHFYKMEQVDVENILLNEAFVSGTFASYHIYPYFPDYLNYVPEYDSYLDQNGKHNTYQAYLKKINDHHTIPVVISEFGIPSSRGMAQRDKNTGRNQGGMSESEQGVALVEAYEDIKQAGCSGSMIFSWQDEWFKRTWNTMHSVNLLHTPYWSDYQTNEQYFGLLAFDPGKQESISYVDGDIREWNEDDVFIKDEDSSLSMKYDEKFIYLLAYQKDFDINKPLYLPIDITPKTGSKQAKIDNLKFEREADFLIRFDGKENSRVLVQERYECARAMFLMETHIEDPYEFPPKIDTDVFKRINLLLQTPISLVNQKDAQEKLSMSVAPTFETYETGLLTYGNANPSSPDFNSLADFIVQGDYIEIKIPWQLLNFSDPSSMMIHDDYYEHYGIEPMKVKEIYLGISNDPSEVIMMAPIKLEGWGEQVTYHERLKQGYYDMQAIWRDER